jgi:hypothetical protein
MAIPPELGQRIAEEIDRVVAQVAQEQNRIWEAGATDAAFRERIEEGFIGTQHAPWWDAPAVMDRDGWIASIDDAARQYREKGVRWQTRTLAILPRSETEAAVAYMVDHIWSDGSPAQGALFLETWVKRDGAWRLLRHTAEKA